MESSKKKGSVESWDDSVKVGTFRVGESCGIFGIHPCSQWSPLNAIKPLPGKYYTIYVDKGRWIIDTNIKLIHCINNKDSIPKRAKRENK